MEPVWEEDTELRPREPDARSTNVEASSHASHDDLCHTPWPR